MALSVNELADELGVTPGDVRVLMAQYAGDVPMWGEPAVVTPQMRHRLALMLPPNSHRPMPKLADHGE